MIGTGVMENGFTRALSGGQDAQRDVWSAGPRPAGGRRSIGAALMLCLFALASLLSSPARAYAEPHVAVAKMHMLILPGTGRFFSRVIDDAAKAGAELIVFEMSTPGGMLDTTQEMIEAVFQSPVPVAIYVAPSGGTATSAGVFITVAGHIAAMAPGTSIGAAHPVSGEGKDIEGDMRAKAENMATAMAKSVAEQRGRNVAWVEKAVKESASITAPEAVKEKVVDYIAESVTDLIRQATGREVEVNRAKVKLKDLTKLPVREYHPVFIEEALNTLSHPNVLALLWLGATGGISIEMYNPGLILPGVIGVICLILALALSSIIPINYGAVALIVVGGILIGLELFVTSGILGVGGVIAMIIGALYLIDSTVAPGLSVSLEFIIPTAVILGSFMLSIIYVVFRSRKSRPTTGSDGLVGARGEARTAIGASGTVFVQGELWSAVAEGAEVPKGSQIEVVKMLPGLKVQIRPANRG